ncbi:MAG: redoxin domain-containing protein, partial [Cyclobacteriaceae bacterium]|nr:redoxin domain-containing protein [Cyclobacteriaceae bacterium]
MNRLKSIFIGAYITCTSVLSVLSLLYFYNSVDFAWLVSAIIHALPVGFIVKLYIVNTPRTTKRLNSITIAIMALTIMSTLVMQHTPSYYNNFFLFILITFFGWLMYINWYSILEINKNQLLEVGVTFPDLTFEESKTSTISTSKFLGKKTIYLFYRGNWCPLCMAQIKELSKDYQLLEEKGVQIVLISPQPHGHTKRLAKKHKVPFIFLTDPKGASAKKLQIYHKNGVPLGLEVLGYASSTVLPTVMVTDEKGIILYA